MQLPDNVRRNGKNLTLGAMGLVIIVLLGFVILATSGGNGNVATPQPQPSPTKVLVPNEGSTPEPIESALKPDGPQALPAPKRFTDYGWAAIGSPPIFRFTYPKSWSHNEGLTVDPSVVNFNDHSDCPQDVAACPGITFTDLTVSKNRHWGEDRFWAQQMCNGKTTVEGEQNLRHPVAYTLGGHAAQYVIYQCDGVTSVRYLIPGLLAVFASDNDGHAIDVATLRAVMDKMKMVSQ